MKILGLIIIFSVFTFLGFLKAKDSVSALEDMKRAEFLLKNIIFCLKRENMPVKKRKKMLSKPVFFTVPV